MQSSPRRQWPLKWKFSKMSLRIPRRDTELRFVTKFGENRPLWSCQKVLWITTQKKCGLHGTRSSPHFAQNGPIAPKIPWTLSPVDMSTYTEFGLDRLRFPGLITERLIFRPPKNFVIPNVNVNANLHSASSQKAPRMRSNRQTDKI